MSGPTARGSGGAAWAARGASLVALVALAAVVTMFASFAVPDRRLITAFNLLIALLAAYLGLAFGRSRLWLSVPVGALGVAAHLLWGFRSSEASLEPLWLALTAAWWWGLGVLLVGSRPRLAGFTLVMAMVGAFDAWATRAAVGQPLLALAGFKLLLTPPWLIAVAWSIGRGRSAQAGVPDDAAGVHERLF